MTAPVARQGLADPTAVNEQVGREQVAVDPHRTAGPRRRREGALPRNHGRLDIEVVTRRLDQGTRIGIQLLQRPPPTTWRPHDRTCTPQLQDELGEICGREALVIDQVVRVRLALDPAVDRPGVGVRARRAPLCDRPRHLE